MSEADIEAPLRAALMGRLGSCFMVREEAPVSLRDGGRGRLDILAVPRDPRFNRFSLCIEVKRRHKLSSDLAERIKQAADYVGAQPDFVGPPISMSFVDLSGGGYVDEAERLEVRTMLRVGHQFRVGCVAADARGFLILKCGPDNIWRERPFAETGDHWPGRAMERLTNTRQRAGTRA